MLCSMTCSESDWCRIRNQAQAGMGWGRGGGFRPGWGGVR